MHRFFSFCIVFAFFVLPIGACASVFGQNQLINAPFGLGVVVSTTTGMNGHLEAVATSTLGLASSFTASYPLRLLNGVLSLLFGTTTSNTWAGTQTFTNSPVFSTLGAGTVNSTAAGTIYNTATTSLSSGTGLSFGGTAGALIGGSNLTINLANTAVSAGSYTNTNLTVDAQGRITAASNGTASGTGLSTTSPWTIGNLAYVVSNGSVSSVATSTLTASSPLTGSFTQIGSGGSLGCQGASGSQAGCLSAADWTTFNGKQTSALAKGNFLVGNDAGVAQATSSIFISSLGAVGIGTTNPLLPFEVLGQARITSGTFPPLEAVRTTSVTNSAVTGFSLTASSSGVMADGFGSFFNFRIADSVTAPTVLANIGAARNGANNAGDLVFITNNAGAQVEKVRIKNTGFVGIGTSTPSSLLNVYGTDSGTTLTAASAAMADITNSNTTANNFSDLAFSGVNSVGSSVVDSKIVGVHTSHTSTSESGDLAFLTRNAGTLSEKIRLTASGLFGIGTTSPYAQR